MKKTIIFLVFAYLAMFSCTKNKTEYKLIKFDGKAQGTYYTVTYNDSLGRNFQINIDSILKQFDLCASIYNDTSIISKVNKNDTTVILNSYFIEIFKLSQLVSKQTNGAFDITVAPLVNAWGFGLKNKEKITPRLIDSLLQFVGYNKIELKENKIIKSNPNIRIDYNAIAQGYSVDIIANFLERNGIKNYLIDVGGEVLGKGTKTENKEWVVGIEKPSENQFSERELQTKIKLKNKALATSGNYRKYYIENGVRYSHTIDPKTGSPVKHSLLSVSVLAKDCATADAFATAFMVMGFEKSKEFLSENNNLDAYFIFSDKAGNLKTFATENFKKLLVE